LELAKNLFGSTGQFWRVGYCCSMGCMRSIQKHKFVWYRVPIVRTTCLVRWTMVYYWCGYFCCKHRLWTPCGARRHSESGCRHGTTEMQGWIDTHLRLAICAILPKLMNNKLGKIITMPDFLKNRYHTSTGSWLSIITLIAMCWPKWVLPRFRGIFMQSLLGLPFWYGAIGLIVLTVSSLFWAAWRVWWHCRQFKRLYLFLVHSCAFPWIVGARRWPVLRMVGLQWSTFLKRWAKEQMALHTVQTTCSTLRRATRCMTNIRAFWVSLSFDYRFVVLGNRPTHVQRVLGQRKGESSEVVMKRARRGTITAGYFKILPVFMFLIPGMIAAALSARPGSGFSLTNPDTALAQWLSLFCPPVWKVLLP